QLLVPVLPLRVCGPSIAMSPTGLVGIMIWPSIGLMAPSQLVLLAHYSRWGGPELPFTITYVEEGCRFDDRTPLGPGHAIIARHELAPLAEGTQITHIVEIEGPDADFLAQQMGFKQEELDDTVANLAHYAEEDSHDW